MADSLGWNKLEIEPHARASIAFDGHVARVEIVDDGMARTNLHFTQIRGRNDVDFIDGTAPLRICRMEEVLPNVMAFVLDERVFGFAGVVGLHLELLNTGERAAALLLRAWGREPWPRPSIGSDGPKLPPDPHGADHGNSRNR